MKVFVQIVYTRTGISQNGMIEEPIQAGYEVLNALKHFGIDAVNWVNTYSCPEYNSQFGIVEGTTKIVNTVTI